VGGKTLMTAVMHGSGWVVNKNGDDNFYLTNIKRLKSEPANILMK